MRKLVTSGYILGCFAFLFMLGCESVDSTEFEGADESDLNGRVASSGHTSNNLVPDGVLTANQYLQSADGAHRLYMQGDGNLVLRRMSDKKALWSSRTSGKSATKFIFQSDGNLVLYTAAGKAVWASNTSKSGATELHLHSAGQLVLYKNSTVVWSANGAPVSTDECPDDPNKTQPGVCGCGVPEGSCGGTGGTITHVGTTKVYDSDGQGLSIARPSGSKAGDLLVLVLHRTDDDLPVKVSGWTRAAECFKHDNGYQCSTAADCTAWHDSAKNFCRTFAGGLQGHDLAQSVFYKKAGSSEPSSYKFNLNLDSTGHPGWAILTALRGAATTNPIRDWATKGCDNNVDSVFPSVYGVKGDMVLLSQSFDDYVQQSVFGAPPGASTFGYVGKSDETGFLYGKTLTSTGETGTMKTSGAGASSCKDALVSLTIKPQ